MFIEAQDTNGSPIRLAHEGVSYGEKFVAFEEITSVQAVPQDVFAAFEEMTGLKDILCDVRVLVKGGPPNLIMRNVDGRTATELAKTISSILHERYG